MDVETRANEERALRTAWAFRETAANWMGFGLSIAFLPFTAFGRAIAFARDWSEAGEYSRQVAISERQMRILSKRVRRYLQDQLEQQERLTHEFMRGEYVNEDQARIAWRLTSVARKTMALRAQETLMSAVQGEAGTLE
jgi:hypothetical protein